MALIALALLLAGAADAAVPALVAKSVRMDKVALSRESRFLVQRERDADQLLAFNLTDLMCEYTAAANLTGTWANPTCNKLEGVQYWGHYLGHFLSATAQLSNATGSSAARAAGATVVQTMAATQAAWSALGAPYVGYLFPYTYDAWANLWAGESCAPVCVPWYIFHKMLAGLLDQFELAGNAQALTVALGMAAWAQGAAAGVLASGGQEQWQTVLGIEWGGMNDALWRLSVLTGDVQWQVTAAYFNHWSWTAPLAIGQDDLSGNHANTHIPEVVGDALGYEVTGNATRAAIVDNFFNAVTLHHSYPTGGSSDGEMWGDADLIGNYINADTEESCTTYNVLKVARHRFSATGDSSFFDFYDRALFNGLAGNQALSGPYSPDSHTVGWIYMLPLGGGANTKPWGASNTWLACCWGTLSETFAKITDSIYWEGTTEAGIPGALYVNLFIASNVTWTPPGTTRPIVIAQESGYPYAVNSTTRLTIASAASSGVGFSLLIRVPAWATVSNVVKLNGVTVNADITPGAYLNLTRVWTMNDVVEAMFTQQLTFENVNDPRPELTGVGSVMWGSTLLALVNTTSDMLPLAGTSPAELAAAFTRSPPPSDGSDYTDLVFTAQMQQGCGIAAFTPISDVVFERFAAIVRTAPFNGTILKFNASSGGTVVPGSVSSDFVVSSGASVQPEGLGGDLVIRSGDPQTSAVATYSAHVLPGGGDGAAGVISAITFSYSFASGFEGAGTASNFSLVALRVDPCVDGPGPVIAVLYSSPPLAAYPYAACDDFSPMVPGGFLAAGDDLWSGSATIDEAEVRCNNITACLGFTYDGPLDPPGPVNVYLKSAINFVQAAGWQTFVSSRVSETAEAASVNHPSGHSHSHAYMHHGHHGAKDLKARRAVRRDPASCFSPAIPVAVSGLHIPLAPQGIQFALAFQNNDRNVRLLLPQPLAITWVASKN